MSTPGSEHGPQPDPSQPYADLQQPQPVPQASALPPPAHPGATGQPAQPVQYGQPTQPGPPAQPVQPGERAPWAGTSPSYSDPSQRPGVVIAAAVMAWVGATVPVVFGIITLFGGGLLTWLFAAAGASEQLPFDFAALTGIFVVIALIFLLWAGLMVWAGIAAFRGQGWGRWVLAVQGGLYLLVFGGLRLLVLDVSVIIDLAYIGGCITMFFLPPAARWYAHLSSHGE